MFFEADGQEPKPRAGASGWSERQRGRGRHLSAARPDGERMATRQAGAARNPARMRDDDRERRRCARPATTCFATPHAATASASHRSARQPAAARRRRRDLAAARAIRRAQLPRVRDERGQGPRAARRRRRPEAGAAPHPLRDARAGPRHAPTRHVKSRARRRRRARQVPPARRPGRVRRAGAHGAGLLAALSADRRPGQLRLARRRRRGGDALHRSAPDAASPSCCSPRSTRARSISSPNYDGAFEEPRLLPARLPFAAAERRVAASRSAWPPRSRPTTCAKSREAASR